MRKLMAWLSGWATTLHIMFFERDTYRQLREPFNPDEYTEVFRPRGSFDPDTFDYQPPSWVTVLTGKMPGVVAELLVSAMMEAGEDPADEELYQVRKTQVTLFAGTVEPGEAARHIARPYVYRNRDL